MIMISTLTATGTPAGSPVAPSVVPPSTGSLATGPLSTGPQGAGSMNAGPAGALPMPRSVPGAALSLLRTARQGLAEAEGETDAGTRYIGAHLAALRAAAAIVSARG